MSLNCTDILVTIIIFKGTKASSVKLHKVNDYENFRCAKNVDHYIQLYPCIFLIFLNIEELLLHNKISNMHIVFLQEYYLNIVNINTKLSFSPKIQWIMVPFPKCISVSGNMQTWFCFQHYIADWLHIWWPAVYPNFSSFTFLINLMTFHKPWDFQ